MAKVEFFHETFPFGLMAKSIHIYVLGMGMGGAVGGGGYTVMQN